MAGCKNLRGQRNELHDATEFENELRSLGPSNHLEANRGKEISKRLRTGGPKLKVVESEFDASKI